MLLKNFLAGTEESLIVLMPLFESELDNEIPNLRPCNPATTLFPVPVLTELDPTSTTESDLLLAKSPVFLTGTTGLFGGTGGGTPLPSTGFRLADEAESARGFRPPAEVTGLGPDTGATEDFRIVPGFDTPI